MASIRQPMTIPYRLAWLVFRFVLAVYFRWRHFNPERVPLSGPVILASNHASFLDPPLTGAALSRPLRYLARDTLFRFPILRSVLRSWNVVPVDRDGGGAAGLRQILDALHSGHAVIIFPEGTRTRDGHLQPAHSGVGLIVLKSDAPVVPVRVFGTFEAYGRRLRFPRPKRVAVKYGEPMHFARLRQESRSCSKARLREIYQEISEEIMAAVARLEPVEDKKAFP